MSGSNSLSSGNKRPVAVGPVGSKVCNVCGKDVAQLPRVKDDQGRYWCKPCEARAAAQQVEDNDSTKAGGDAPGSNGPAFEGGRNAPRTMTSSPRAVGNGIYDTGDGLDLSAAVQYESQAEAVELPKEQQCPSCHGHMEQSARVCIHCGYDRQRKTRLSTKVEKVKAPKGAALASAARASASGSNAWLAQAILAVGLLLMLGYIASPWIGPAAAMIIGVPAAFFVGASVITAIVMAFVDKRPGIALAGILYLLSVLTMSGLLIKLAKQRADRESGVSIDPAEAMQLGIFSLIASVTAIVTVLVLLIWAGRQERDWLRAMSTGVGLIIVGVIVTGVLVAAGIAPPITQ